MTFKLGTFCAAGCPPFPGMLVDGHVVSLHAVSATLGLQPGDVICTGSPAGNGVHHRRFLKPGDVLQGSISGLDAQRNVCVAERR